MEDAQQAFTNKLEVLTMDEMLIQNLDLVNISYVATVR